MSDIQRGFTFQDGSQGTAAQLHQLVDSATILPDFIASKNSTQPGTTDSFIFYQTGSQALKRCTLAQLIDSFPQGGPNGTYALRQLGTQAGMAAAGNDSRFPVPLNGIRKGNPYAADTVATPKDLTFVSKNLSGLTVISWDDADVFYDTLTADKTYTMSNIRDGRCITVCIKPQGHTATISGTFLGAAPVANASANVNVFTFINTPLGVVASVFNA